jgi:hypothetical protein
LQDSYLTAALDHLKVCVLCDVRQAIEETAPVALDRRTLAILDIEPVAADVENACAVHLAFPYQLGPGLRKRESGRQRE